MSIKSEKESHRVRKVTCNIYNLCADHEESYKTVDQANNPVEKWVSDSSKWPINILDGVQLP